MSASCRNHDETSLAVVAGQMRSLFGALTSGANSVLRQLFVERKKKRKKRTKKGISKKSQKKKSKEKLKRNKVTGHKMPKHTKAL